MVTVKHKIGDSIKWTITSKDSSGANIDLTGFTVNIDAYPENSKTPLFYYSSDVGGTTGSISITDITNGVVEVLVKNTTSFKEGDYLCDVQYIDSDGFKSSSNNFKLKVLRWI